VVHALEGVGEEAAVHERHVALQVAERGVADVPGGEAASGSLHY